MVKDYHSQRTHRPHSKRVPDRSDETSTHLRPMTSTPTTQLSDPTRQARAVLLRQSIFAVRGTKSQISLLLRGSSLYLSGVFAQGGMASSHDLNGQLQTESLAMHRSWLLVRIFKLIICYTPATEVVANHERSLTFARSGDKFAVHQVGNKKGLW